MQCSVAGCYCDSHVKGLCRKHYSRQYRTGSTEIRWTKAEWVKGWANWSSKEECLIWPFGRHSSGYATVSFEGRRIGAHRLMCIFVHGPASGNEEAAHTCGNGSGGCINPNHLVWSTPAQNQRQRKSHGTSNAGERNGSAKLTQEQVDAIRRQYADGSVRQKDLAAQYGVSRSAIGQIIAGKIWLARVYGFASEREQAA